MKIISNFIDYYDYVQKQYGTDDKLTYIRPTHLPLLKEWNYASSHELFNTITFTQVASDIITTPLRNRDANDVKFNIIKTLIVCGVAYKIRCNYDPRYGFINQHIVRESDLQNKTHNWQYETTKTYFNTLETQQQFYVDLCIKLKQPVFLLEQIVGGYKSTNSYTICISENLPNLKDLGFNKVMQAHEVYQVIAQFISTYFVSVDPPITVDNDDKIVKAGFDLKTSFRHRT
jgi:hypothetical protein